MQTFSKEKTQMGECGRSGNRKNIKQLYPLGYGENIKELHLLGSWSNKHDINSFVFALLFTVLANLIGKHESWINLVNCFVSAFHLTKLYRFLILKRPSQISNAKDKYWKKAM